MTPELLALLGFIVVGTGALLSYWAGWRARGAQRPPMGSYGRCLDPDWRRSFRLRRSEATCGGGEITLAEWEAMRTPFAEGRTIRGNGTGGTTTPKPDITPNPQPLGARLIGPSGAPIGYRPNPSRPGANPPPRNS